MAKVFLICGKICCGKSVYAKRLCIENKAIVLSVDDIMLSLFGLYAGEKHDEYTERLQNYLFGLYIQPCCCNGPGSSALKVYPGLRKVLHYIGFYYVPAVV